MLSPDNNPFPSVPRFIWIYRQNKTGKDLGTGDGGDIVGIKLISKYKPSSGKGQRERL